MPILQIDTYDRAIFESTVPFTDEDLNDRTDFLTLPPPIAEMCKDYVLAGAIPSERQPADGIEITEDKIIVTLTWFDLQAAQEYVANKLYVNNGISGLISSEVVVRD